MQLGVSFLALAGTLAGALVGVKAEEECNYAIQLLHLQDSSGSFSNAMTTMTALAPQILGNLTETYPGTQISLASFTDKPIPGCGYGSYGGYWLVNPDDCYTTNMPWTTNASDYQQALNNLWILAGMDFPEAQLEALYQAAYSANFTMDNFNADGRPIVRIIMQITDAPSHKSGDYIGNVLSYNTPRTWDETTKNSTGGWGSTTWSKNVSQSMPGPATTPPSDNGMYSKYFIDYIQPILYKVDHGETLTEEEKILLEGSTDIVLGFGPPKFPEPQPHPDQGQVECQSVEYPEVSQVGKILMQYNITPIVLVADPTPSAAGTLNENWCQANPIVDSNNLTQRLDCMQSIYSGYFAEMGLPAYSVGTMSMDATDVVNQMMTAIGKVVQQICLTTTTTTTTTVATTTNGGVIPPPVVPTAAATTVPVAPTAAATTVPVAPTAAATTVPVAPTAAAPTVPVAPTAAPTVPVAPTTATTVPVTVPTTSSSTTATTSTTEGTAAAAAADDGGSSTAVIASAAAGGAVALAAGFLAYKKLAVGALSKGNAAALQAAGQVDVPDAPVEREAMEEITMEMFR